MRTYLMLIQISVRVEVVRLVRVRAYFPSVFVFAGFSIDL